MCRVVRGFERRDCEWEAKGIGVYKLPEIRVSQSEEVRKNKTKNPEGSSGRGDCGQEQEPACVDVIFIFLSIRS